jgi:hypothetical protein
VTKRRPKPDELAESAGLLRDVLDYFPASEDKPRDAVVRRRVEGAIAAAELAAGEPASQWHDHMDRIQHCGPMEVAPLNAWADTVQLCHVEPTIGTVSHAKTLR